jgi:hypothetical protein
MYLFPSVYVGGCALAALAVVCLFVYMRVRRLRYFLDWDEEDARATERIAAEPSVLDGACDSLASSNR